MQKVFNGTESAERVADVLMAFSRAEEALRVTSIANELNLSKAVVHRILQSLVSRQLVDYSTDSREYRLGSAAVALGARALRLLDIRRDARIHLMDLRDTTGETTTLSLLSGDKRMYVDQFESPHEIKMTVELGRLHWLHAGSSSRAILAYLPPAFIERILEGDLPRLTENTLTSRTQLLRSLDVVRTLGFANSFGERQSDAASVAAPVFGLHGDVLGSISICGPQSRLTGEWADVAVPALLATAKRISEAVAASPRNSQ